VRHAVPHNSSTRLNAVHNRAGVSADKCFFGINARLPEGWAGFRGIFIKRDFFSLPGSKIIKRGTFDLRSRLRFKRVTVCLAFNGCRHYVYVMAGCWRYQVSLRNFWDRAITCVSRVLVTMI